MPVVVPVLPEGAGAVVTITPTGTRSTVWDERAAAHPGFAHAVIAPWLVEFEDRERSHHATEEEKARVLAEREEQRRRALAADARAQRLLSDYLCPADVLALGTEEGLRIPSTSTPGREYSVRRKWPTIRVFEDGKEVASICVHLAGEAYWAEDDTMLGLVLTARYREEELRTHGNWRLMVEDVRAPPEWPPPQWPPPPQEPPPGSIVFRINAVGDGSFRCERCEAIIPSYDELGGHLETQHDREARVPVNERWEQMVPRRIPA